MKKRLLFLLLVSVSGILFSQKNVAYIQSEIDSTVWKSFQNAFETLDATALNNTYGPEVLRVTPKGIDTENSFREANEVRFKKYRAKGTELALDFWFDSRHTNQNTSYEVGFYRIAATDKNGSTTYSYGQFHIVLQKLDNRWKIVQDWDTTTINGTVITEKDFAKNNPIKF